MSILTICFMYTCTYTWTSKCCWNKWICLVCHYHPWHYICIWCETEISNNSQHGYRKPHRTTSLTIYVYTTSIVKCHIYVYIYIYTWITFYSSIPSEKKIKLLRFVGFECSGAFCYLWICPGPLSRGIYHGGQMGILTSVTYMQHMSFSTKKVIIYEPITIGPHTSTEICWLAESKHER